MGSLENFHHGIMKRVRSGELELGISKMAGTDSHSVAFSAFWTLFAFLTLPVFFISVPIRRNRGRVRARQLAEISPDAFQTLWEEGALSLKVPSGEVCMSPQDDYRKFMAHHFLTDAERVDSTEHRKESSHEQDF